MKHQKKFLRHFHPDAVLIAGLFVFIMIVASFILSYAPIVSRSFMSDGTCSRETRVCPGGIKVSRSGPRCEFTACPNNALPNRPGITEEPFLAPAPPRAEPSAPLVSKNEVIQKRACTDNVKLCPDGSFVGKTGPNCEFAPCPSDLEEDTLGDR